MELALAFEASAGHSGVDERDEDVSRSGGCGQAFVEVGQAARVDENVTLLQVRYRAVVPRKPKKVLPSQVLTPLTKGSGCSTAVEHMPVEQNS